jgi:hypothetical protein
MIGLTWRTARHQGHWDAADSKSDELIRTWGMTKDEASDPSRQKPSYLCVLLKTAKNAPAGVLFMDSSAKDAFGRNDDEVKALAERLAKKCEMMGFQQALENVVVELRKYDTGGIQIHA